MNRNDFLKQLSGRLAKMTKEEHDEIIADFNEYFSCAAAEGKSEEETSARLGDPKKIAKEYYSQKMIEEANAQKSFKSMGRAVAASMGIGVANFFYAICVVAVGYIVIASLYIAVCSVGLAGIATVIGSALWIGAAPALGLLGVFTGSMLISLAVLGFAGVMKLAVLFAKGNMRFLNMTRTGIKGGLNNE